MLKITVGDNDSDSHTLEIQLQKGEWYIGESKFDGDIVQISARHYHVIWNNQSFSIEVVESDLGAKTFQFLINGRLHSTSAKNEVDMLLEGLGMNKTATNRINHVKAPMPGLIQSILVQEGDEVDKGDSLLVLVAMKMENVIKASGLGIVKSLKIVPGQIVEKNQVLLEFQ